MFGRFVAMALIAVLGGPMASPWAAAAGAAPGCSEGVCVCAHHAPQPRPESAPCHGAAESREPRCEMRAACNHQQAGVTAAPPYLLPVAAGLVGKPLQTVLAATPARRPLRGLRPVETDPPRAS